MLKLSPQWQFDSPGSIVPGVANEFSTFISRIAAHDDNEKSILEHFKSYFAGAAGVPYHPSSDTSWAATDLDRLMSEAAENAPLFIDAFYSSCRSLEQRGVAVPDDARINRVLAENNAGYEIRGGELIATREPQTVVVPARPKSLDQQSQEIVEQALSNADRALAEGNGRQAVQELLWLLESIATAFRGAPTATGSVHGDYFNKIVAELRNDRRNTAQEQILNWMMTLHGFLSSPKGGGIRHGLDLKDGTPVQINEARLYCNLIRSYITYLMTEHERLQARPII
ncbi:hypothetical protein [Sinorhizobium fredii]|uniref:hypothetical protein n=1 Tax=Rhizobium fredii TaxID=380 RepID=UPI0004BCB1D0|nr:hypothetical protein [Sinorhizobium fredii]AWI58441.1 hypothetical protein AB395_00002790 [Sinorhizobium fredii CCBAU 45436]